VRVAVLDDYQNAALTFAPWDQLAGVQITTFTEHLATDDAVADALADFEIVVAMRERTPFTRDRLNRLPKLRLLVTTGMGNASIDLQSCSANDVVVAGTGFTPVATVELTWGLILAAMRHICDEHTAVRERRWQHTIGPHLDGLTLGVIGLGNVGSRVAKIGQAFGMTVVAWSQNLDPTHAAGLGVEATTKDELLKSSDVVTIHLRLSERTVGIIGSAELQSMKSTAFLVNTSRGPIVDEEALLAALGAGQIAGAGVDVYDSEPLPVDHPLRSAPRVVTTPHLGYVSTQSFEQFYGDAVEDIAAFMRGAPVRVLNA
jgi:phosphoglycerate dehydrogenase-like enzyme